MAKFKIGGREYTSQPLKFRQLKKAFPLIKENQQFFKDAADAGQDPDPIEGMERAFAIVAIALERDSPEVTAEFIADEIDAAECIGLQQAIIDIITESGFEAARPGEGVPAKEKARPSTATSTD